MADMENKENVVEVKVKESFFKKLGRKAKEVGVKVKNGVQEYGPKVGKGLVIFAGGVATGAMVVSGIKKHAAVDLNDEYEDLIDTTYEDEEEEDFEDEVTTEDEEESEDEYPEE